jgi:hypothetical protein
VLVSVSTSFNTDLGGLFDFQRAKSV